MENEKLRQFLYKTQLERKLDFSKFIFYYKNIIAFIIASYVSLEYGESYFIASFILLGCYIYLGYKKSRLKFYDKLGKFNTGNFYNLISKININVFKKNDKLYTELLFADIFLNRNKNKKRKIK